MSPPSPSDAPPADLAELEERLSRPGPALIRELAGLPGDLVVLGAGGKMGPSLARMARRALDEGGSGRAVIAVSRFSDPARRAALEEAGVRTLGRDLLDPDAVRALPDAGAVVFLVGTKFGTGTDAARTWAVNAYLPGLVAERYRGVPAVVLSSGNVYPLVPASGPGADEATPPAPLGEYAASVLARERVFEHFSRAHGTRVTLVRLNYAAELRYGVPVDVALAVHAGRPIELSMGYVNLIWQGDANERVLRALSLAASPPAVLNLTGPERVSVRELAERLGGHLGREPRFEGRERPDALLADASCALAHFGPQAVPLDTLIEWVAVWVGRGAPTHGLPTHYEVRDGAF